MKNKAEWEGIVRTMLAEGYRAKDISDRLGCSYWTGIRYIRSLFPDLQGMKVGVAFRAKMLEPKLRELAGMSYGCEDIGPKLNISPQTAMRYLRLLKIPFSRNNRFVWRYDTSTWHKDVVKWYRDGIPRDEIAKRKKVSVPTIQRFLKNNGYVKNSRRSKADYA